jgi:TRAP-type uncharacterized transport system substrate-binding protein
MKTESKKTNFTKTGSLFTDVFRLGLTRVQAMFTETFGLSPAAALSAIIFVSVVIIVAGFWFFRSAPPDTLIITSGDDGSRFQRDAEKYAKILVRNGVKLKILPSEGSLENLERLENSSFHVDIGFVQAGVAKGKNNDKLVSLGSISYEPLFIFYRSNKPINILSQFSGKRLAIGEDGTGTQVLALELLAMNGIKPGGTTKLLEIDDDESQKALLEGKADAAFMMSDSASSKIMHDLLRKPGIKLFDFTQADAYTRRIGYLNKLVFPKGSIDFGKNIPDHDVSLIGPTVELIARSDLHPALSDLLLEAATEVHSRASMFQHRGEFPVSLEHEYRISSDASRFYKSGKSFLYRYLPFWMASMVNRILVVFLPMVLVLIPGLKSIPAIFRWRVKLRIYRWYRLLLVVEQDMIAHLTPEKRTKLLERLDRIEEEVNKMKVPASFADQFYVLRGHISFVRERLTSGTHGT